MESPHAYTRGVVADEQMSALAMAILLNGMDRAVIARWTDAMIASGTDRVHFWRDKQQREVDLVVPRGREAVDAIECKWNPSAFEPRGPKAFPRALSQGLELCRESLERTWLRTDGGSIGAELRVSSQAPPETHGVIKSRAPRRATPPR